MVMVAQLVERWVVVPEVAGSNPVLHPSPFVPTTGLLNPSSRGGWLARGSIPPEGLCLGHIRKTSIEKADGLTAPADVMAGARGVNGAASIPLDAKPASPPTKDPLTSITK